MGRRGSFDRFKGNVRITDKTRIYVHFELRSWKKRSQTSVWMLKTHIGEYNFKTVSMTNGTANTIRIEKTPGSSAVHHWNLYNFFFCFWLNLLLFEWMESSAFLEANGFRFSRLESSYSIIYSYIRSTNVLHAHVTKSFSQCDSRHRDANFQMRNFLFHPVQLENRNPEMAESTIGIGLLIFFFVLPFSLLLLLFCFILSVFLFLWKNVRPEKLLTQKRITIFSADLHLSRTE